MKPILNPPTLNARHRFGGFTLMEIVVCIGVLAVALAAIIPSIGFSSGRADENSRKAQAAGLLETAMIDLRNGVRNQQQQTDIFEFKLPTAAPVQPPVMIFFDSEGHLVGDKKSAFYQCQLEYHKDALSPRLTHIYSRVTWPAAAKPGREQGAVDLFTSLFRP